MDRMSRVARRTPVWLLLALAGCATASPENGEGRDFGRARDAGLQFDNSDLDLPLDVTPKVDLASAATAVDFATAGCVANGVCSTGYPGACASGHLTCSGNVGTCVPDATTQPCYDGAAGTMGVGACHAGTQTCVGALGACTGEVVPATVENCFNTIDDDCNNKVNDGCPTQVVIGTPVALTARGGGGGGGQVQALCPANEIATGAYLYFDDDSQEIAGVGVDCSTVTLVKSSTDYSLQLVAAAEPTASFYGGHVNEAGPYDCPSGQIAMATQSDDGSFVDGLGIYCATDKLTLSASNQLTVALTKQATAWGYDYGGDTQHEDDCAAGDVLVGFYGHDGAYLDSFTAVCAPLTFK